MSELNNIEQISIYTLPVFNGGIYIKVSLLSNKVFSITGKMML